jgi:hypothetical protein
MVSRRGFAVHCCWWDRRIGEYVAQKEVMAKDGIFPPCYPLSREAFLSALWTGHGRALVHARKFGVAEFREEIFETALISKSFDSQVDGFREKWLAELLVAADLVDRFVANESDDDHVHLRCALLGELALNGHLEAKLALYRLCRFKEDLNDVIACEEIIGLNGREGFLFVVRVLGKTLVAHPEFWVCDWLVSYFDSLHGDGAAELLLDQHAGGDEDIARYTAAVRESRRKREPRFPALKLSIDEVVNKIRSSEKPLFFLRQRGKKASDLELSQMMDLIDSGLGACGLANALRYFAGRGFPRFQTAHLRLLEDSNDDVRFQAAKVLSYHTGPELRLAGLGLLACGDVELGVEVLCRSAQAEDGVKIFRALEGMGVIKADECPHGVICAVVAMLEANDRVVDLRIPYWVYERSACMHCRTAVVEVMIDRGKLPTWMEEECRLDGNLEIRELVAGLR